jgi:hypothetical protein
LGKELGNMPLPILILHANRRDFSQSALEKTVLVVCKKDSVGDKKRRKPDLRF